LQESKIIAVPVSLTAWDLQEERLM